MPIRRGFYDPANNFSEVKYRYDIGANVRAQSPAPAGNVQGKITERIFDSIGRLQKDLIVNSGAYTRYEYSANGIQSKVFTTIIDTNGNNTGDTADEVLSESWADGAGRVLRSRTEHPESTGGWAASIVEYDILGRAKRSSVPTEVSVSNPNDPNTWQPAGDDLTRGFLWTHQKYDWMGRVVRKINTDGIDQPTLNDSDVLMSYEGCGCAGGLVTAIQGESVPRDDQPTVNARRVQKVYEDILGRSWKTVVYKWDGVTPYTTTEQTFNGRDQIINTKQIDNTSTATPQTNQNVTLEYDGHGRMKTRHYPIEDAAAATTWIYNADDSVQQVIDPRGAITNFTYNNRGLTEQISYDPPANPPPNIIIPDTPTVNFTYDNLGNRTQMTDGLGNVLYEYDELSRLRAEVRQFNDNLPAAPLSNNRYRLQYEYHLGGGVKSYSDPFNSTINNTNDKQGRLMAVSGTPFGDNVSGQYADSIQYRAFGAVKQLNYKTADNSLVKLSYDARLRVTQHEVTSATMSGGFLKLAAFEYFADSRPKFMDNFVKPEFDRSFSYDFAGRLTANQFGVNGIGMTPYSQFIQYDAFSQMSSRQITHWNRGEGFTAGYLNGRKQATAYETPLYDAAGNLLDSDFEEPTASFQRSTVDAAGRRTMVKTRRLVRTGINNTTRFDTDLRDQSDGDGRAVKQTRQTYRVGTQPLPQEGAKYQIWSSVLQSAITELKSDGSKSKTRVFAGGTVIAEQIDNGHIPRVVWQAADPVTGSSQMVRRDGTTDDSWRVELEPLGQEILPVQPNEEETPDYNPQSLKNPEEPEWLCSLHERLNTGFFDLPVNCRIAALERGNLLEVVVAWPAWPSEKKQAAPVSRLPNGNSPNNDSASHAANTARSFALTSSTKKDDGDGDDGDGGGGNCPPGTEP